MPSDKQDPVRDTQEAITVLGRVVATERKPNSTHQFHFWTSLSSPIGIGTIVVVHGTHPVMGRLPRIYGVVVEGLSFSDLQSPIEDVVGHSGVPDGGEAMSAASRPEIRLYTAAVLRQLPDEPLQPVPLGSVYMATEAEVATALRMDSYLGVAGKGAIPAGVYTSGGLDAPVYLDPDFLLGPEAAHLNIAGVSGLATKTSAVEWLLAALFAHFPAEKGTVAALCFNVKGPDLCFLDQPARSLNDADLALYEKLGVPAAPFRKVEYYAPYNARGTALNTLRSHPELQHNVNALTWGLREVLQYAEVLLNRDDIDAKADALIDFIAEKVVDREFSDSMLGAKVYRVQSFADLEEWFRDLLSALESSGREGWRTHHAATIRKVRNRLSNISTRCAGLVTDDGVSGDLPFGSFADRTVYVVDVANLEEDAQDLIFARVVTRLREQLERRELGVNHLVVFVDELNKYAAADAPDSYVRRMLLDIAERGRYLGLVLFGAQQFRSQVHRRLTGNAGTSFFGRMDIDELASPVYATLNPAVRTRLAMLDKGQIMVRHPHFTQPIFIRFPRPAVLSGREGMERFPREEDPGLEHAVWRALRRLDSRITFEWVRECVAGHREEDVLRSRNRTVAARPRDVSAYFRKTLPARPQSAAADVQRVSRLRTVPDPHDPYTDAG